MKRFRRTAVLFHLATLCVTLAAQDLKPSELEYRGISAMHAGEYEEAERIFKQLTSQYPKSFVGHYNLAAAHARQDELPDAVNALSVAITLGFSDKAQLERDPDLENLRETRFYQDLMNGWAELLDARRQADSKLLRGLIKKKVESRTDDAMKLELLSAHDTVSTNQALEELQLIEEWAVSELFPELEGYKLEDSPWVFVVLPDRTGFASWAMTTFGPSVRGSISGIGGAYEHQNRRLVAQDLGATLRHEFVHVLHWRDMNRLGQAHAPWIQEGFASLIEDYDIKGARVIPVPSWRTNIVKRLLDVGRLPSVEDLTRIDMNSFTAKRPLAQYAQARTLVLWLYETQRLQKFYAHYMANISQDPTGYRSILTVTQMEPDELESAYRDWVRELESVPETGRDLTATLGIEIENGSGDGVVVQALSAEARRRTGLRLGTVITHLNDRPTRDLFELIRVLGDYDPGDEVTLHTRRGKVHGTTQATLTGR